MLACRAVRAAVGRSLAQAAQHQGGAPAPGRVGLVDTVHELQPAVFRLFRALLELRRQGEDALLLGAR